MKKKRLGFVMCRKLPDLTPNDRLLVDPLSGEGYRVEPVIWTDDAAVWKDYDALVLRSTWDYHHKVRAFHVWLDMLEKEGVTVFNDIRTVRWNVDKWYLAQLSAKNIAIPRTAYVDQTQASSLGAIMEEINADRVVIKPSVSASGDNTWLCSRNEIPASEKRFKEALNTGALLMVQEYLKAIETEGEWSLMFFAGVFSHAVIKRPRPGEFRVQEQFGGSTQQAVRPRICWSKPDGSFLSLENQLSTPEWMAYFWTASSSSLNSNEWNRHCFYNFRRTLRGCLHTQFEPHFIHEHTSRCSIHD